MRGTTRDLSEHQAFEQALLASRANLRQQVLERDNYQCQSCGRHDRLELHHWRDFRALGGGDTHDNLVTLCNRCHGLVHSRVLFVVMYLVFGVWRAFVRGAYGQRVSQ